MKSTVLPIKRKDHRTFSFNKTFGTIVPNSVTADFSFDTLQDKPDQNADNLGEACTAYTDNDIASNEDSVLYDDRDFTYRNTLMMMNVTYGSPCDVQTALKSTTVYGVKKKTETAADALTHRRGPYFIVQKLNGSCFQGLISAMQIKKGCLSCATPWYRDFEQPRTDGTVPSPINWTDLTRASWHAWEACGVKTIGGQQCIIAKSWQGSGYGDNGYVYFTEGQINALLSTTGSGCFGQKHVDPNDIQTVDITLWETAISYAKMILEKLLTPSQTQAVKASISPVVAPLIPNTPTMPTQPTMIEKWADIIADEEGAIPALNNPGNFKYTTLMASWGGQKAGTGSDGGYFCRFPTPVMGRQALINFLTLGCEDELIAYHNARTIKEFTLVYTNHPKPAFDYSDTLIKRLGVTADTNIATFLS